MISLPIPEGLKLPESGTVELPVQVEIVGDGTLEVVAIGGIPLEQDSPEEEEGEAEAEAAHMQGGPPDGGHQGFMAAVEQALAKKR